ncbi:MAG TPA: efflux RND transporter periplasmic adaptor subunit, partial [Acidobacteriota bacterium]|nr:efflux RND transporter periplasmic adaptor subunit [Acidobacteriota bacterium]
MRKAIPLVFWVIVLLIIGCGEKPAEKIPTPVRIGIVADYNAENDTRYSADIEPKHKVSLAFKVGGYIEELYQVTDSEGVHNVQGGDIVKRGTILASLRKVDFQARVDQAQGQIGEAQADQARASQDFERATKLLETNSMTRSDFDAAKAKADSTKARVESAKGQLQEAQIALQDSDLRAPMDAVVIERKVEMGELVNSGQAGFVLADSTTVKAVFGVPDVAVGRFAIGQRLHVLLEAFPQTEFRGGVTTISPAADPHTRLFQMEVTIPNEKDQLKTGMIATIVVPAEEGVSKQIPVVPLTAVVQATGKSDQYAVLVVES